MAHVCSQDGYDFLTAGGGVAIHDRVIPGDYDFPIAIGIFPQVPGESHLIDKAKGRDIQLPICLSGFAGQDDLDEALEEIRSKKSTNTGDLTIDETVYPKCTFIGIQEQRRGYDGSGVNGWLLWGVLIWRQRSNVPTPAPGP